MIRTSEVRERLSAEDAVRHYKRLAQVERAFRCLKGIDLLVRPIHHHTEAHVRAHFFVCLLAYYVAWHLRDAWAPLLFHEEGLEGARRVRDAVAAPTPSAAVIRKKAQRQTPDGLPVHSFDTLLETLATRAQHTCRLRADPAGATFVRITERTPLQARAFHLLGL